VISSTGARQPILTRALFKKITKARRWRQLVVIDIAVPRDAEPAIGELDGVYVFDIDDLEKGVAANLAERAKAGEHAPRQLSRRAPCPRSTRRISSSRRPLSASAGCAPRPCCPRSARCASDSRGS